MTYQDLKGTLVADNSDCLSTLPKSPTATLLNLIVQVEQLADPFKLGHAARANPLSNQDVTVPVKTSVVGMHKFAVQPHLLVITYALGVPDSLDVAAQLR